MLVVMETNVLASTRLLANFVNFDVIINFIYINFGRFLTPHMHTHEPNKNALSTVLW